MTRLLKFAAGVILLALAFIWMSYKTIPHARKSFWDLYDENTSVRVQGK